MTEAAEVQEQSNEIPLMPSPVRLTDKAVDMVKQAMEQEGLEGHGLRVGVIGGGCSGLQYLLDFSKAPLEDDFVSEALGVSIYVDPYSAAHLAGTEIDYTDGLNGSGFKFNNPRIVRSCGCGSSFHHQLGVVCGVKCFQRFSKMSPSPH
ncbi:MAG: iron-sulfur cluster assembly accessory protein [Myxococcota bacterium]